MRRRTLALVLLLGGSGAAVHHLGLTTGSTRQERRRVLPGDGLLARPRISATHATSLAAPPDEVWPWLLQVGWHRGGWYTPRWVDVLMFPDNLPSADRVVPELQGLEVGDWVPDGPPGTGCGFEVREVEPHRHLVLESTTHLPPPGCTGPGPSCWIRSRRAAPASCSAGGPGPGPGGSPPAGTRSSSRPTW